MNSYVFKNRRRVTRKKIIPIEKNTMEIPIRNGRIDSTAGNTQVYFNWLQTQGGIPNFRPGLGYSPASGPSVGAPLYLGKSFFGYPIPYDNNNNVRKASFGKGKKKKARRKRGRRRSRKYGYALHPPAGYDPVIFPRVGGFTYELGPGTSPGGIGGIKMGNNQPLAYFSYFGKSRQRKSRSRRSIKKKQNE